MFQKRRGRLLTFALILLGVVALISACSSSSSDSSAPSGQNGNGQATDETQSSAQAEPIELTYATYISSSHYQAALDKELFKRIEEQTNGRVKVDQYYDGTLVEPTEWYQELLRGTADIIQGPVGSERERFSLDYAVAFFNYGITDLKALLDFTRELWESSPSMQEQYKEVVPLTRISAGTVWVHTVDKPIRSLEDFKGLNLKVADDASTELAKALGANPVRLPISETYAALEKGTIDGVITGADPLKTFKLAEVVKYSTELPYISPWIYSKIMNKEVYEQLPADIQQVIMDNARWYEEQLVEGLKKEIDEGLALTKEKGNEVITLSPEETEKLLSLLEDIAKKVAADLDSKGLEGTQLFEKARQLAEKYQ